MKNESITTNPSTSPTKSQKPRYRFSFLLDTHVIVSLIPVINAKETKKKLPKNGVINNIQKG